MDALIAAGNLVAAIGIYRQETCCTAEEVSRVVDDWPEQRLRLQLDLLTTRLQYPGRTTSSEAAASLT
jgi:hypothetical protein